LGAELRRVNGRNDSTASKSSLSSSSALTITQSLFSRSAVNASNTTGPPESASAPPAPPLPPLEYGPKLFFTSAKTGEGVREVFDYVAKRVIVRWEWEVREWDEEGEWVGDDTIRVGLRRDGRTAGDQDRWGMKVTRGCCAS